MIKEEQLAKVMTLKDILFKLETNQPFALTRWGDGEWYNIILENLKEPTVMVIYTTRT